jgi:hypothetical protein
LKLVKKISIARKGKIFQNCRDQTIYTFRHPDHGDVKCTRHEFTEKYSLDKNITYQMLCKRPVPRQGWIVVEKWAEVGLLDEYGNIRKLNRDDYAKSNQIYTFTHVLHGTINCTTAELKNNFGLTKGLIRNMFMILPGTSKGWKLVRI